MEAMKQGLIKLFEEKKLIDFTITCGPYTFGVHKAVICSQSQYFAALPNFVEGANNKIDLKATGSADGDDSCDDPEAIKHMVQFFYHHDYRAKNVFDAPSAASVLAQPPRHVSYKSATKHRPPVPDTDGNMIMHAQVFAAACKYRVPALENVASDKFNAAVSANWDHHSFAEAARIVFTTTPEDVAALRAVVIDTIDQRSALLSKVEVKTFVKSEPDLMYSLLCKNYGVLDAGAEKVQLEEATNNGALCESCYCELPSWRRAWCGHQYRSCCQSFCYLCGDP